MAVRLELSKLSAPLLAAWQLTRRCDLSCIHCCVSSGPNMGRRDELAEDEALRVASEIVSSRVPYVLLCGGEPLLSPRFFAVAEALGRGGVELKIESNGQRLGEAGLARLARLPIRSVQISLDGDTQDVYAALRPGASLEKALSACRSVVKAGLPLEIAFAPTRLNMHEAEAVLERAFRLGAFRFNTGALMPLGRAAGALARLEPGRDQYEDFRSLLRRKQGEFADRMELCYVPFTVLEGLQAARSSPPATLLILPDGRVKVSAALPYVCADLRRRSLAEAWDAYRAAWKDGAVLDAVGRALREPALLAEAEELRPLGMENLVRLGAGRDEGSGVSHERENHRRRRRAEAELGDART